MGHETIQRKGLTMQYVLKDKVFPEIGAWADELAQIRRDIHAHPELGFETKRTVALLKEKLRSWGVT